VPEHKFVQLDIAADRFVAIDANRVQVAEKNALDLPTMAYGRAALVAGAPGLSHQAQAGGGPPRPPRHRQQEAPRATGLRAWPRQRQGSRKVVAPQRPLPRPVPPHMSPSHPGLACQRPQTAVRTSPSTDPQRFSPGRVSAVARQRPLPLRRVSPRPAATARRRQRQWQRPAHLWRHRPLPRQRRV
jgi:hypothetical protein